MKLITKKYLFKNADTAENGLCVKVVCGVEAEHDELVRAIKNDSNVVFCGSEYINEIDLDKLSNAFELIKKEENLEENKNEKV